MATLPQRPLGKQGMMAGMQGYGCMGLTAFYGKPVSDEQGVAVMQKAFDLGVTMFDTAEVYVQKIGDKKYYNEELVGKFAAKVGRDKIQIATKYMPGGPKQACSSRNLKDSVARSLQLLGTDYIDLYYLHRVPDEPGILEAWMTSAKELVAEGKVKYLGLSEATPDEIRRAHAIHPLTAIQQEYSLLVRSLEASVVPVCRELGIAIVAYSPLCRGFATAKVKKADDWAKIGNEGGAKGGFQEQAVPMLAGDNIEKNAALLAPVEVAAEKNGATPSQVSLAWVQAQGDDIFPIPGTTKIENLTSNVEGAHLSLKLDKAVFVQLSKDVDVNAIQGDRYIPAYMVYTIEGKASARKDVGGKKIVFYDMVVSNNAARIRLWLKYKQVPDVETKLVTYAELKTEEYKKANPLQKVPGLILADGTTVFESNVILSFLEDKYSSSGPTFKPPTPEARCHMELLCRIHDLYIASPNCTQPGFSHTQGSMYLSGMDLKTRAAKVAEIWQQLTWLNDHMKAPYMCGDAVSLADFTWYPTTIFMEFMLPRVFEWPDIFNKEGGPFPKIYAWWQMLTAKKEFADVRNDIYGILAEMEGGGHFKHIIDEVKADTTGLKFKYP